MHIPPQDRARSIHFGNQVIARIQKLRGDAIDNRLTQPPGRVIAQVLVSAVFQWESTLPFKNGFERPPLSQPLYYPIRKLTGFSRIRAFVEAYQDLIVGKTEIKGTEADAISAPQINIDLMLINWDITIRIMQKLKYALCLRATVNIIHTIVLGDCAHGCKKLTNTFFIHQTCVNRKKWLFGRAAST